MFRIPFSILPLKHLKIFANLFRASSENLKKFFPSLSLTICQAEIKYKEEEYISLCLAATSIFFVFINIVLILLLVAFKGNLLIAPLLGFFISIFVFMQQIMYPRLFVSRRIRELERNLMPALQDFLIQLKSGIPLFDILVKLSNSDYDEVSKEFKKTVKQINTGTPQIEALENLITYNPSLLFRRVIWQIVNGMKSGSDMANVLQQTINSLGEQQLIQIQNYGSQLNPLAMFYLLIAVILPSLGITFLIILISFLNLQELLTKIIFAGLYIFILFFQITFIGLIKTRRPNLV